MQHTSISPDRKLMTVVGDHLEGLLVDSQNGKVGNSSDHALIGNFCLTTFFSLSPGEYSVVDLWSLISL